MRRLILIFVVLPILLYGGKKGFPEWVLTHKHPGYPSNVYLIGIGIGNSLDEAKNNARVDLASQIEVKIESELKVYEKELTTKDGYSYAHYASNKAKSTVEATVSGVEIKETGYSEKDKKYYALAVLHRMRKAEALESEISRREKEIMKLLEDAKSKLEAGDISACLEDYTQAIDIFAEIESKRALLSVISPAPRIGKLGVTLTDIDLDARNVLRGISIEKVAGDKQEIEPGKILASLKVKLTYKDRPLRGVKVRFIYKSGDKAGESITNDEGIAEFSPTAISGKGIKSFIIVRPVLNILGEWRNELKSKEVVFEYTLKATGMIMAVTIEEPFFTKGAITNAIKKVLTELGYGISHRARCSIQGVVNFRELSPIEGFAGITYRVEATITLKFVDRKTKKELTSLTYTNQGSGNSKELARSSSAKGLAKKLEREMRKDLPETLQKIIYSESEILREEI